MDIKELSVGDWVYNKHHERNIQLTAYDFFTHGHDAYGFQYLLYNSKPTVGRDFEPIPLTEEFFEKNFIPNNKILSTYKIYESEDNRIRIMDLTNSGDGYWNVHVDNEDYDTIGSCDVKYVHQFQQLLRLCGYEMDVVV